MPAPVNSLKAALHAGRMQIGCWLNFASPMIGEIAAGAGFDWCLIDAEHAPYDLASIRAQMQAMAATGTPVAVRVPAGEVWMLKQVLDLGAQSVLVPMVDSADQAAHLVGAVRFPPQGRRGLAPSLVRASGYDAIADYATTANDQVCLMVQAESGAAVDNIDAIAATEGVDGVFIGPYDLAADLGHLGNPAAPVVIEAIAHCFARYRDLGVTMMAVAADVPTLAQGLRGQAARAREILG